MSNIAKLVADLRALLAAKDAEVSSMPSREHMMARLALERAAVNAITPIAQGGGGLLEAYEAVCQLLSSRGTDLAKRTDMYHELRDELASALLGREEMQRDNAGMAASLDLVRQSEGLKATVIDELERLRTQLAFGNLCDIVAANRGWSPLVVGESMTVGFGDAAEYTITRNADREYQKPKEHYPRRLMGEDLPKHLPCDTGDVSRDGTIVRKTDDPESKAFWNAVHDLAQLREQIPEERRREAMSASNRGVPTFEPVTSAIPGPPMSRADRAIANERIAPSPRVEGDETVPCKACHGLGYAAFSQQSADCPSCNGTGVQS